MTRTNEFMPRCPSPDGRCPTPALTRFEALSLLVHSISPRKVGFFPKKISMYIGFSTDHYQNTSTADEYGRTLYIVSTCGFLNRKTTVHKVNSTPGSSNYLMKLAAIKCGLFGSDKIWFRGRRIQADRLMAMRGVLSSCVVLIAGNVNGSFKLLGASEFVCGIGVKSRVTNVS